jgi:hypothetical protein
LQSLATLVVVLDFEQRLPFGTQRRRKGIGNVEGDHLRESRFIAMRQVTAFVPTFEACFGLFGSK